MLRAQRHIPIPAFLLLLGCGPLARPEVRPEVRAGADAIEGKTEPEPHAGSTLPEPSCEGPAWQGHLKQARWQRAPLPDGRGRRHVLAVASHKRSLWAATHGGDILESTDGGESWSVRREGTGDAASSAVSLLGSPEGVWAGTAGQGFGLLPPAGPPIWWGKDEGLCVPGIVPSGDGALLVATTKGLRKGGASGWTALDSGFLLSVSGGPGGPWVGGLDGLRGDGRRAGLQGAGPVRDILMTQRAVAAATDQGLLLSLDAGRSFQMLTPKDGLPSSFVSAVADVDGAIWLATARGLAVVRPDTGKLEAVYRNGWKADQNQVLDVHEDYEGTIWAATAGGLWQVRPPQACVEATEPPGCVPDSRFVEPALPGLARPVGAESNPYPDQTAADGRAAWFDVPPDTAALAVADGEVSALAVHDDGTSLVLILHDMQYGGLRIRTELSPLTEPAVRTGALVRKGQRVGTAGGRLRLRVLLDRGPGAPDGSVVNPLLLLRPVTGTGAIAGVARDGSGRPLAGAQVAGAVVPVPRERPFAYATTYGAGAGGLEEGFAVVDVPAGTYRLLATDPAGKKTSRCVAVEPGRTTWVDFGPGSSARQ